VPSLGICQTCQISQNKAASIGSSTTVIHQERLIPEASGIGILPV
jgi:hypothetical protein